MELILYSAQASRGLVCEWLLEELSLPYTLKELDLAAGAHKSEAYLKIHPLGSVPALVVSGRPIIETLAIRMFLAEQDTLGKLAPVPVGASRGAWLQWMVYPVVTLEPALVPAFMRGLAVPEEKRRTVASISEQQKFAELLKPLHDRMVTGCVFPEGFGAVDIGLCCRLLWADQVGLLPDPDSPALTYLARHTKRDAFVRATRA
jgi:glutathione S-transferase